MRKIIFCVMIAALCFGCAMMQTEPDRSMTVPECVHECGLVYEQCIMGCRETLDSFGESSKQEQCKRNCRNYTNECKTECEEK